MTSDVEDTDMLSTHLQDANAVLQVRLQEEQGNRREERFGWIVIVLILIDALVFKDADNAATPIVVAVLEICLLAIIARRLGISQTAALIDKVLTTVAGEAKPKDG